MPQPASEARFEFQWTADNVVLEMIDENDGRRQTACARRRQAEADNARVALLRHNRR